MNLVFINLEGTNGKYGAPITLQSGWELELDCRQRHFRCRLKSLSLRVSQFLLEQQGYHEVSS